MRNYQVVIREAQLLASSPQTTVAFLEKRATFSEMDLVDDAFDKEFEAALLSRQEPLINLALAQYAKYDETVLPLFEENEPGSSIRLAILSNTIIPEATFVSEFPLSFMQGPEKTAQWIATAPDIELTALFENPLLDDSFLQDLLEHKESPWSAIAEDKLCFIVGVLARNKRMQTAYKRSYVDAWSEHGYCAVFDAAWTLAATVPVGDKWAKSLAWLFDKLHANVSSLENPLAVAERWFPDPSNSDAVNQEKSRLKHGHLFHYQTIRKGLGRLALSKQADLLPFLLSHGDVAFRSAAYASGDLTEPQLVNAFEVDGELAFTQAQRNALLWKSKEGRHSLKRMAWGVVDSDDNADMLPINIYTGIRSDFVKKHPDWFKDDEDYEPEANDEPATKADIAIISQALGQQLPNLAAQIQHGFKKLEFRVGWIFWFSLGALAMGLTHL